VQEATTTTPINREAKSESKTKDFTEKQEQLRNSMGYTCKLKRAYIEPY